MHWLNLIFPQARSLSRQPDTKSNYDTVTGEKKVVIAKKDLEVKVDDQKIVWGNDIDNTKYNVSGLTEGDGISEVTLKASTTALTDNGTISVSSIAITNGSKDVTSNYDIALSDGKLVIEHNTKNNLEVIGRVIRLHGDFSFVQKMLHCNV